MYTSLGMKSVVRPIIKAYGMRTRVASLEHYTFFFLNLQFAHIWKHSHVVDKAEYLVPNPNIPGLVSYRPPQLGGVFVCIDPDLKYVVNEG